MMEIEQIVKCNCLGRPDYKCPIHGAKEWLETILDSQTALTAAQEHSRILEEALLMLYEETKDYITINHLGDPHHNRSMQLARAALATGRGEGE